MSPSSLPSLKQASTGPARPELCIRPPCLKRNNSAPPVDGPEALPFICSFSAPRSFSCNAAKRSLSVRFNASAPEAYPTHSSVQYDRTPIKCTRGGEQDLSMPPRGCKTGMEEEADESLDDDELPGWAAEDHNEDENGDSSTDADSGFAAWVGYRQRQAYSLASAYSPRSDGGVQALVGAMDAEPYAYRGLRSIGALCQRRAATAATPTSPENMGSDAHLLEALLEQRTQDHATSPDCTPRRTSMSSMMLSPDATPMPSPSVARSVAAGGGLSTHGVTRTSAYGEQSRDVSYFSIEAGSQDMASRASATATPIEISATTETPACRPCSSHSHGPSGIDWPAGTDRLEALTHGDTCDLSVEALLGSGLADCIADPIARMSTIAVPPTDISAIEVAASAWRSEPEMMPPTAILAGASPRLLRQALAALPSSSDVPPLALLASPMSSRSSSMDSLMRPSLTAPAGRPESLASYSGESSPPTSWTESGAGSPEMMPSSIEHVTSLAQRVPAMSLELPSPGLGISSACSSTGSVTPPTSGGSSPLETPYPKIKKDVQQQASLVSAAVAPVKVGKSGKPKKTPEEVRARRERDKKREAERERRILGDDAGALGGF